MAKTSSWSTPHAVAAGADVSEPPRDSGSPQPWSSNARWMSAPSKSTQKRSIRPSPQETALIVGSKTEKGLPRDRGRLLLRGRERTAQVVGDAIVESSRRRGGSAAQGRERDGCRMTDS